MKKLKHNNTPRECGLKSDLFKYAGKLFRRGLILLLNTIWYDGTIQEGYQKLTVILISKSGDIKIQENCRSISLLNVANKIDTSIIKNKLMKYYADKTEEEQNKFQKWRYSCDGYFYLKLIIEET